MKIVHLAPVLLVSFILAACGGGGGGSSTPPDTGMTEMCPAGQTGTPPNCMVPGPTAEEIAAATKAAGTKKTAIAAEAEQTTDAGLGGTDAPTTTDGSEGEYTLAIKYGETSITVEGASDADDEKFMQAMDLGGGTTMHTRTMDADDDGNVMEEVVMVSTDIEAPKATAFAMVAGQALNAHTDTTNDNPTETFEALSVVAANVAQVMSSGFSSSGSGTLNYANDDSSTTNMDEAFETTGTYNGAPGTYRCNGTSACSVTYDAMGMITSVAGDWVFTPDAGATSDVPDSDYLHYGFWLKKTTDKDGAVTYNEVETFAGSSITATTSTSNMTGKATYSGNALGVYVHSVTNPDGTEASATSGHFTANVALTAYFGQVLDDENDPNSGTIAPGLLNSISGTINNFMLSGHDTGPGWSVALEQSAITPSDASIANGMTKGGGDAGSYSAMFYGGDDTSGSAEYPSSVVGEFNANFSNGSVAGGFGARED